MSVSVRRVYHWDRDSMGCDPVWLVGDSISCQAGTVIPWSQVASAQGSEADAQGVLCHQDKEWPSSFLWQRVILLDPAAPSGASWLLPRHRICRVLEASAWSPWCVCHPTSSLSLCPGWTLARCTLWGRQREYSPRPCGCGTVMKHRL